MQKILEGLLLYITVVIINGHWIWVKVAILHSHSCFFFYIILCFFSFSSFKEFKFPKQKFITNNMVLIVYSMLNITQKGWRHIQGIYTNNYTSQIDKDINYNYAAVEPTFLSAIDFLANGTWIKPKLLMVYGDILLNMNLYFFLFCLSRL